MFFASSGMSIVEASKGWQGRIVEGKFPLVQWLGGSDHSAVFLTERAGHNSSRAAIKLIGASGIDGDQQLSRWRTAAQLSHPNLVRIFQAGTCRFDDTSLLYLVTECADEDLSQILPHRPLTTAEVGDMLPPLLDAIAYLHRQGLVHGRIKPSNILAIKDQLKLSSDYVSPATEGETRRRDVYDAPETAAGILSPESDMWSVGVTLLAAMTQTPSLTNDSRGDPTVSSAIAEPYRGIIRECLHLDPKRRCSVSDVLARLQPAARSVPMRPEPVAVPRKGISRGSILLAVAVAAVLSALLFFYARGKREAVQAPSSQEQTPKQSQPASPSAAPVTPPAPAAPSSPTPSGSANAEFRGTAVRQVLPPVPQSARNTITGKIRTVVRVDVNSDGKVTAAKLTNPGPSHYFANLALKAAKQWEFSPPTSGGQPQPSAWALTFRFGRTRTEATPERLKR